MESFEYGSRCDKSRSLPNEATPQPIIYTMVVCVCRGIEVLGREGHFPLDFVITCVNRVFCLGAIYLVILILRDPFSKKKSYLVLISSTL
jgi:hypothetical protein